MQRRPRLATLRPRIAIADLRTAPPPPKTTDPHYHSAEHEAWAQQVCERAGWQCEWPLDDGSRCPWSRATGDRMFADHIKELKDGGLRFDLANGMCLCGQHHSIKTHLERAKRLAAGGVPQILALHGPQLTQYFLIVFGDPLLNRFIHL